MIADCCADNVPEPEFSEYSNGIAVTFDSIEEVRSQAYCIA